jgi:hypothetical protein
VGSGVNGRRGKGDGGHADEEVCHRVLWGGRIDFTISNLC